MVVCGGGELGIFTVSTMGGGTALDSVNKTQSLHKALSSISLDLFSVQLNEHVNSFCLGWSLHSNRNEMVPFYSCWN